MRYIVNTDSNGESVATVRVPVPTQEQAKDQARLLLRADGYSVLLLETENRRQGEYVFQWRVARQKSPEP